MGGFLLRKVGAALIVLVLASMLVFVGVRAIPGDPALALGGENRDPAVLSAIRHKSPVDDWKGGWQPGTDPERRDYASFAEFADPDGNTWVLQEIGYRGRLVTGLNA